VIGADTPRPDVRAKITGTFRYSNDLEAPGMLYLATVRSPHAHAELGHIDATAAAAVQGFVCVLDSRHVPARRQPKALGEQPILAEGVVRFCGEPVALVVAATEDAAWQAAALIRVEYQPLPVLSDATTALAPGAPAVHPGGNLVRHLCLARGELSTGAPVEVEGRWEIGRQDPGFLGLEAALAVPGGDGGVTVRAATQDVCNDQRSIALQLGLEEHQVRVEHAGMGGAFGGRERITLQAHVALAALALGRPVKATYRRHESFVSHAKRHPGLIVLSLGATEGGEVLYARGRVLLDGGAYAPEPTSAVLGAVCYFLGGPYRIPAVDIQGDAVYTNNPISGAMRGFGAPQACFAVESTMDLLAARVGMDPVELRRRNALRPGDLFPTSGQLVPGPAPVREVIDACASIAMPPLPRREAGVRRGVGFALGVKNVLYGEGEPEWAQAEVVLDAHGAVVRSSAAECGQGALGVLTQIATAALDGIPATVPAGSTDDGYAGSSSASRQTWMSGSAVMAAAADVSAQLRILAARCFDVELEKVEIVDGQLRAPGRAATLAEVLGDQQLRAAATYRAPLTRRGDPLTGEGPVHAAWMFVAHRAVVDVDVELGSVRLVQMATAQDVGLAINPREVRGQMVGGSIQGFGFAVMEDLRCEEGVPLNDSFSDYLMPTAADGAEVVTVLVEQAEPQGPFGAKGVGEPPSISSTAAVVAAIRDATGRPLPRIPARPEDCVARALSPDPRR